MQDKVFIIHILMLYLNILRHIQLLEELQIHLTHLSCPASERTDPKTKTPCNVTASMQPRLINSTVQISKPQHDIDKVINIILFYFIHFMHKAVKRTVCPACTLEGDPIKGEKYLYGKTERS